MPTDGHGELILSHVGHERMALLAQLRSPYARAERVPGDAPPPVRLNDLDFALFARLGRETVIKIETFNPIRSFKGRGADYFMRQIPSGRTVACASAGNFGQAIAYAGSARPAA